MLLSVTVFHLSKNLVNTKDGYDRYLRKALIVSKPGNCALAALRLNDRKCHVNRLSSRHTTQAFEADTGLIKCIARVG